MIALWAIVTWGLGTACTLIPGRPPIFDELIDARMDLRLATVEAERTGRHILLVVGGNGCPSSYDWEDLFAGDSSLATSLYTNFEIVHVSVTAGNTNDSLLDGYPKHNTYPHFVVLDAKASFLHLQTSEPLMENEEYIPERVEQFLADSAPR